MRSSSTCVKARFRCSALVVASTLYGHFAFGQPSLTSPPELLLRSGDQASDTSVTPQLDVYPWYMLVPIGVSPGEAGAIALSSPSYRKHEALISYIQSPNNSIRYPSILLDDSGVPLFESRVSLPTVNGISFSAGMDGPIGIGLYDSLIESGAPYFSEGDTVSGISQARELTFLGSTSAGVILSNVTKATHYADTSGNYTVFGERLFKVAPPAPPIDITPVLIDDQILGQIGIAERDGISISSSISRYGNRMALVVREAAAGFRELLVLDNDVYRPQGNAIATGESVILPDEATPSYWVRIRQTQSTGSGWIGVLGEVASSAIDVSTASRSNLSVGASEVRDVILIGPDFRLATGWVVDGYVITGPIQSFAMNDSGDYAAIVKMNPGNGYGIVGCGGVLLEPRGYVDADGDTDPDFYEEVSGFLGSRSLSITDRYPDGSYDILFTAYLDRHATDTIEDDVMGLMRLNSEPCSGVISCQADINGNGIADPADFSSFLQIFTPCLETPVGANCDPLRADQNNDGQVTPADFTAWVNNYEAGCN